MYEVIQFSYTHNANIFVGHYPSVITLSTNDSEICIPEHSSEIIIW